MANNNENKETGEAQLAQLGYHFVNNQLLQTSDGAPFEFLDQDHYDIIGDAVATYIEDQLVQEGLVGVDLSEYTARAESGPLAEKPIVYVSPGVVVEDKSQQKGKTLVLLIQGSGVVRVGQWSRALCINESLEAGSQVEYIKRILAKGWDVIVFNPNQGHTFRGPISRHAVRNVEFVWEKIVEEKKTEYQDMVVIAHSYGAHHTLNLLDNHEMAREKVRGIAFTDGVFRMASEGVLEQLEKIGRNWVTSELPLDEEPPFHAVKTMMPCVSAGHVEHIWTSASSIDSVFRFVEEKLEKA